MAKSPKGNGFGYPGGNELAKVSDAEITATPASEILDKTKAFPDDTNVSPPRCYDQCVEDPNDGDNDEDDDNGEALNNLVGPACD